MFLVSLYCGMCDMIYGFICEFGCGVCCVGGCYSEDIDVGGNIWWIMVL